MLHAYQTERGARARAIALGRGATITRSRHGGWYAVGPVEIDAEGRRDRMLHGINRREWWVTTELDAIRARGVDAPAEWSAIERELRELLTHATPAELIEREQRELRAFAEAEEERVAQLILAADLQEMRDEDAREEERRREALRRSEELNERTRACAPLRAEVAALDYRSARDVRRGLEIGLEIARTMAIRCDVEFAEARLAEHDQRVYQLRADASQYTAGSTIRLPQHDRTEIVSRFDEENLVVWIERKSGLVAYDAITGCRVEKR